MNTNPGCPPRELAEDMFNRNGSVWVMFSADSEVYTVHDAIWQRAGMQPGGGCLCIDCLEKRIGRRLKPRDFLITSSTPCRERRSY